MKTQGISIVVLFILIGALNSDCSRVQTAENNTSGDSAFVPHPQKVPKQDVKTLEIGSSAPDFRLPGIDGKFYSLADFSDSKILVFIFTCNHCPTAQAYEDRIIRFTKDYSAKNVGVVAIMPNSTTGLLPEECGYTDLNDSYDEMKIRAAYKKYNFPYLYDGDNQSAALAYGPVATPHAFVFNGDRKLSYVGRLDAIEKPGKANAEDLRAAVDALLAGKEVDTPVQKTFGCSVKWEWKGEYGKKIEKEWNERPVILDKVSLTEIKAIVKNPTSKLRLINVWATWCAPCIAEYASLVELQRWYGQRDFEFISISADNPENFEKALTFLKAKHSGVKNYIGTSATPDNFKLIDAVDPKWMGGLPYTLLVEPGGKIVYSYLGSVDLLELKRAIVDHPMIGRYY